MAPRNRPSMGSRLDKEAPAATVTPIGGRARAAFSASAEPAAGAGTPVEVPVDLVDPSPDNPRSELGDLTELAESIKELGVLQPVLVRPNGDRYDLIYGHRRLAASKLAKRKTIPVLFNLDEDAARTHARRVVENVQRKDLTHLEEARAMQQLLALGVAGGQRGVARMLSVSQTVVSQRLSLLKLPADVQDKIDSGAITVHDGTDLAKLADDPAAVKRAVKAGKDGWGGYPAAVKRELQDAADRKARQAAEAELRAAGVTLLTGNMSLHNRRTGPYELRSLLHQLAAGDGELSADQHAKLPCHAAVVPAHGPDLTLVCTDPQSHFGGSEAAEEEEAGRAAERAALDAARLAAAEARRDFMRGLVRKGAPDAGAALLMGHIVGRHWVHVEPGVVADLLGLAADTFNGKGPAAAIDAYVAKGTRNAQRAVYAAGLALGETGNAQDAEVRRGHFDHLVACGYLLSDFEKALLAEDEDDFDEEYDEDLDDGEDDEEMVAAGAEGEGGEA